MTKNTSKIAVLSLFAAALVAMPALSRAEGTNASASPSQAAPAKPKKHEGLVFRGTVSAIDAKAMTLTVETVSYTHLLSYLNNDVTTTENYRVGITARVIARERATGKVLFDKNVNGYTCLLYTSRCV